MNYGVIELESDDKTLCEYSLGPFACVSMADYRLITDFKISCLCLEHLNEFKRILTSESTISFDESVMAGKSYRSQEL